MNGEAPGGADPQAGGAPQGQEPTRTGGQEPPASTGQAPAADPQSGTSETPEQRAQRLEREVQELRKENAGHRKRSEALEREKQQAAQAGMSEAEKAAARAQELEDQNRQLSSALQEQRVEAATVAAATKLNYRNPELASRLLDRSAIEYDEGGKPKNVEALLRALASSEPYLVKGQAGDFGGGNRGAAPESKPGMNELLRAAIKNG